MLSRLASGILLHTTSLPGAFEIGDLGPEAVRFVDWLADSRQGFWQFLPLGPPGDGDSPYQSLSAFAGSPLLISPDGLAADGLLARDELRSAEALGGGAPDRVDFARVHAAKDRLLRAAYDRFAALPASHALVADFEDYCRLQAEWLDDFALFMALREINGQQAWTSWRNGVNATKEPLPETRKELHPRVRFHAFVQWAFDRQWDSLHQYARERGIRLIGDLPIYVSHDGADVWAHRELFCLNGDGSPSAVAGVPPDYFSQTGQLWNNPLYDWEANRRHEYQWWVARVRALLSRVDYVRLDHFRGYQAYWEVPAGAATAEQGRWVPGPGDDLFLAIDRAMAAESEASGRHAGRLPFIAENLGFITHDVDELQHRLGLPGMVVLQFALTGAIGGEFDPARLDANTVIYTGTHDNNTTRGWLEEELQGRPGQLDGTPGQLDRVRQFVTAQPESIAWELIELAWRSSACLAVTTAQDLLNLGSGSRMNRPGTVTAQHPNWSWRMRLEALDCRVQERLAQLTADAGRG
ncbi:MAG: 4-alpha-glucanotransferase [Patescibacteria group bacterium]|nr:4-alpha-glucanotransferase [Patescibacteria group bacterium]